MTPSSEAFKLDPASLCAPVINTQTFLRKLQIFNANLLNLDQVKIASGTNVKSKVGPVETKITTLAASTEFNPNPCKFNEAATSFYSPTDYNDLSLALGQINVADPVIFAIEYNNATQTYSNLDHNMIVMNPDLIIDADSVENKQKHGCLYEDNTVAVCTQGFQPTLALCSQETLPNREQRRLNNKLDTLVLQGEESVQSVTDRVKSIEKNKSGNPDPNTLDAPSPPDSAENCLPLVIHFAPDVPPAFTDLLVSSDEYPALVEHIRAMANFLEVLEENIQLLEHDDFQYNLKLVRPVLDAASYIRKLFTPDTMIFTIPAAVLALFTMITCCIGVLRCLRPKIQEQNRCSTLQTLALRTETRPMLAPPSYVPTSA